MALNLLGNQIKKIKILKNKVSIIFESNDKLEISKETYTNYYFFEGKTLTLKEIKEIKKTNELNKYLGFAIKSATSSLITEKTLKNKLYKKGASTPIINDILKILKKNDILNDDGYILDYIEYGNEMNYGQLKIKDNLIKKGIDISKADKIKFSKTNELNKAKNVVKILEKRYANISYPIRKQKIYQALLNKGFLIDIALQAIKGLKDDGNDELILNELKTLISRYLAQNEHKYESREELFDNLYAYLRRKGYSYSMIKKVWGEYYEFND